MNGTRTARMAALAAALALGLALAAATLMPLGPHDGLHPGRGSVERADRTPVLLRSQDRGTAATPRTTPRPTFSEPAAPDRPTAATTVEHS